MTERYFLRILAPLVYAVSILPLAFAIFIGVRFADYYLGLPMPLTLAVPILLIGIGGLGGLAWLLSRIEGLRRPRIVDHVRHCAIPYAVLVFMLVQALRVLSDLRPGGAAAAAGSVVFISVGCAVTTNALVLFWQRRRFLRTDPGSAA